MVSFVLGIGINFSDKLVEIIIVIVVVARSKTIEIEFMTLTRKIVLIRKCGIVVIRVAGIVGNGVYLFGVVFVAVNLIDCRVVVMVVTIGIRPRKTALDTKRNNIVVGGIKIKTRL